MFTSQHTLQNPFYMLGLEYNATLFDGNTRARVLAALKLKQQQIETDNDTADRELNDAAKVILTLRKVMDDGMVW